MTEEQRPARAYQPWTDQEYELLEKRCSDRNWTKGRVALSLARYPDEIEPALEHLRTYNEKMTNRNEAVEHRQAIKSFPEHLIDHYGSGLRPLDAVHKAQAHANAADRGKELSIHDMDTIPPWDRGLTEEGYKVHKPKTSIPPKEDLAGIDRQIHDYILRKARRLIINGKDYDRLLRKVRERVHLQIEISATLAGGK